MREVFHYIQGRQSAGVSTRRGDVFDPATGRLLQRLVEEPAEFARIRRLHPAADEELLRRLSDDFALQSATEGNHAQSYIARLEQTLSNTLQLSPQKGLLAEELEAELDQLLAKMFKCPLEVLTRWTRPGRFVSGAEMVEAGLARPIDLFEGDVWQQIARLS